MKPIWAVLIATTAFAGDAVSVIREADVPDCVDAAGQHLNYTAATKILSCGTTGGGSGAPIDATYIVQTANATLTAEQAMGALGTGIVINTTTTGVQSIYGGSACGANTVARSTNASGALTCSAVVAADISGAVATADALSTNPSACPANQWVTDIAAAGTLTCAQPAFSNLSGTATDAQLASSYSGVGTCTNQFARALNDNAAPTCEAVSLTADVTGTLPVGNGGLGMTTVTDDTVAVANGTAWQSKAVPSCSAADSALTYNTGTNAFGCNTIAGGSGVDCIYIPLWSWVAQVGTVTTTTACTATTNIGAVANRGHQIFVDMDRYTHAKLLYFGNVTGTQTGTVTVALRDIAAGSDSISTTFNSGTSCVTRGSATTDLTAKTGLVPFTARLGDSTAADDPALSSIHVQFCNGSF